MKEELRGVCVYSLELRRSFFFVWRAFCGILLVVSFRKEELSCQHASSFPLMFLFLSQNASISGTQEVASLSLCGFLPQSFSHGSLRRLSFRLNRRLMEKTKFKHGGKEYDAKYPEGIPTSLTIQLANGQIHDSGMKKKRKKNDRKKTTV